MKLFGIFNFLLLTILFSPFLYSDWPTFARDNSRSGYSDSFIQTPLSKIWETEIPGEILSSPVIYKNKVFITTRFGYVVALDLKTGDWLWDYSTAGFNDSTPYVSSDTLIVSSMDSKLYAFDINVDTNTASNAKIKWIFDLKAPSLSSPLVYKNKVYVGAGAPENSIYIIDFFTGQIISKRVFEKPINSVIGVCENKIIFGGNDGKIYSMSLDGSSISSYQTEGGSFNMKSVSCDNGKLFSLPGYDERRLYVNRSSDTSLLYNSMDLSGNVGGEWNWQDVSSISISTDTVYFSVGTSTTNFIALNKTDYSLKFTIPLVGDISNYKISPSPSTAQNKVFFTTTRSKFYILTSTGAVLQSFDLNSPSYSSPAISDGWVVVSEVNGKISGYKADKYLFFVYPEYDAVLNSTVAVKLNFKDNPDNYILDYSVYGMDNFILISSGNILSGEQNYYKLSDWDISNLSNGDYVLRVRFFNSNTQISYATTKLKINKKLSPPQNLTAVDNPNDNCNKIKLTFDSVVGAVGYKIYRSSYNADNWSLLDLSSSTVYVDKTALCNATFSYKVTAYDDWFESDYSNIAFAYSVNDNPLNDSIAPGNVSDLSLQTPSCPGVINYKFTQTGDDGFYGKAYYYEVGYSTFLPFSWDNSIKIKKTAFAISGDIESGMIEDLIYGVTYYIGVKVYDYAGNSSDLSNIVSANALFDNIPPAPPVNFIAYDTPGDRGGRITLEWEKSENEVFSDCDKKIYGYKILKTTKTFDYSVYYATVSPGVWGFIDSNAITGLRYNYRVCSYDSSNMSCADVKTAVSADNFRYVSVKNGGALSDEKGSAIFIRENSLNQDDYLIFYRIKKQDMGSLSSGLKIQSSDSFVPTDIVYKFESSNTSTKLNSNAEIKITYLSTETTGIEKNNLRMYYYDNGVWKMLRNSKINTDENSVVAEYDKFGYYALFGYKPQGDVFDSNWVYTYPNPAKGDFLTFKFVVNYKSDVDIEIYNVAGEIIKKITKKDVLPGLINEIVWDIKNIASGVYIYVFKVEGSGGKKSVNKKLAIIH